MNKLHKRFKGVMLRSAVVILLGLCFQGVSVLSAVADEGSEAKLLQKIDALEKRIQTLESTQPQKEPSAAVTKSDVETIVNEKVAQVQQQAGFKLPEALKDITLSGFVDTSYQYNTNHPSSGLNTGRVFDT